MTIQFRYPDAMMARILAGCESGEEWWGHHPYLPVEVSSLGHVRDDGGQLLTQGPRSKGGYPGVYVEGVAYYVHALVLETFVGPRPDGMECCHWKPAPDGGYDNRLMNLRWDTRSANAYDRERIARRDKRQAEIAARRHTQTVVSRADRPDRQQIARRLAVLEKLEQLVT